MAKKETKKNQKDDSEDFFEFIQKEVGQENIRLGLSSGGVTKIDTISTRCLSLDAALGIGGVPHGRTVEIFGPEASGKTTLALTVVAECQSKGGRAAFIDVEHAVDPTYATAIGVDIDKLIFSQPDSGEKAIQICDLLISSGKVDVVIIDSVAALVPQAELDGEIEDVVMAGTARLMSKSLRRLTHKVNRTKTCLVFINQIREKIGGMPNAPKTVTPGGRALKFYASIRMDIARIATLKQSEESIGNRTRIKVVKNKLAPPFKVAEFDLIYGKGISAAGSIIDVGVKHKIIERSGSWFSYNNVKLGMGLQNAVKILEENPDMAAELDKKLRAIIMPKPTEESDSLKPIEESS